MQKSCLDQLIFLFSKLPGLGSRSARRIVLHLLENKDIRLNALIDGLKEAVDNIVDCQICNNLDYHKVCNICNDENRSDDVIAIVETVAELLAIERSEVFMGKYHVIGSSNNLLNEHESGLINLKKRCHENNTKELIIATNPTLDGQTKSYFIAEYFKDKNIKISRLAIGVPIGGEIDYLDEGTLSAALQSRGGL